MLSFNSCSSLFSGIFSSPTRKGNVAPPSRAWQRVKKRSKWLSWQKNPKQKVFSNMTGKAEIILMCLVWIIYLCVYRWHCHDLKVKKSFMTFHPLNWRNLKRKFLKNNKNEIFCLLEFIFRNTAMQKGRNYLTLCVYLRCVQWIVDRESLQGNWQAKLAHLQSIIVQYWQPLNQKWK